MKTIERTALVAIITFASGMMGFLIQWLLPVQHVADSKGAIGSVVGLVTLLLALVLGLVIWTSFGVYTTQQSEAHTLGSAILQLDFVLERYGPEAVPGRRGLKQAVGRTRERFWGHAIGGPAAFSYQQSRADLGEIEEFFASLHPPSDEQRHLLDTAKQLATSIVQTNLLMSRQLANPVPALLLIVVVSWSSLLFLGFGLLANFNPVTVVAEALGAMSVASAIFLILEFSHPYSGLFSISGSGIDQVLSALIADAEAG
jgi:hypothetical protein